MSATVSENWLLVCLFVFNQFCVSLALTNAFGSICLGKVKIVNWIKSVCEGMFHRLGGVLLFRISSRGSLLSAVFILCGWGEPVKRVFQRRWLERIIATVSLKGRLVVLGCLIRRLGVQGGTLEVLWAKAKWEAPNTTWTLNQAWQRLPGLAY